MRASFVDLAYFGFRCLRAN